MVLAKVDGRGYTRTCATTITGVTVTVLHRLRTRMHDAVTTSVRNRSSHACIMEQPIARIKVLCVADDAYFVDLLRLALMREGYLVQAAVSPADAMHVIAEHPPDLALVDVRRPIASALSLCTHLRETLDIPIIIMSAHLPESEVLAAFSGYVDHFFTKPFALHMLVARLGDVLRARRGS